MVADARVLQEARLRPVGAAVLDDRAFVAMLGPGSKGAIEGFLMRADMHEVIIERPRWAHADTYPRAYVRNLFGTPRSQRALVERGDDADAPTRERMGTGYREKQLSENLQPLVRFLRSRVGKPWAKVRSEIAEHLRVTSAVQKHVMDHLKEYVITSTWIGSDGRIWGPDRWGRPKPIVPSHRPDFYVHPKTGLLAEAPTRARKARRKVADDPLVRRISPTRQLRRIDGIWFDVELRKLPPGPTAWTSGPYVHDVVARCQTRSNTYPGRDDEPMRMEWRTGYYAFAKRQLSKREIVRMCS